MLFHFLQCKSHHLYRYDFVRCMSDTLAWCRTEMELEFSELVICEQLEVYWRRCFCFLGSARLLFSLPRQLLLPLSTSRSSPVMNESMFCSQSTSTQKVVRKRRGVQEHVRETRLRCRGGGGCQSIQWWWVREIAGAGGELACTLHFFNLFRPLVSHSLMSSPNSRLSIQETMSSNIPSSLGP